MFQIRSEIPSDGAAVETLNDLGFGVERRGRTVYRLRLGAPTLSFIAADPVSDQPLATLRFWPVMVGLDRPALLLGPLAVIPERRGEGLGRALVGHGLSVARDRGWRLCLVSGDPDYYRPFGFEQAAPYGFAMPGPIEAGRLQVKALAPDALGTLPRGAILPLLPWRGHRGGSTDGDEIVSHRRLRVG
ncbi:N-acetyltransferase [Thalassobaculum sp.]|uniref:GNAT family N-acetyltransferase n=1 Tax=Thalassobaculum sp. TaxID=2022740 RepID=UPI0032EDE46A